MALYAANAQPNHSKLALLKSVDVKLGILKMLARIAFDVHAIDPKKYLKLEQSLQEIGKMLGGWMKSLKNENPAM